MGNLINAYFARQNPVAGTDAYQQEGNTDQYQQEGNTDVYFLE